MMPGTPGTARVGAARFPHVFIDAPSFALPSPQLSLPPFPRQSTAFVRIAALAITVPGDDLRTRRSTPATEDNRCQRRSCFHR